MRQPPLGPPIWTALKSLRSTSSLSLSVPPAIFSIIWRRVVPKGTSISPVFAMLPVMAKVLVPAEFCVP